MGQEMETRNLCLSTVGLRNERKQNTHCVIVRCRHSGSAEAALTPLTLDLISAQHLQEHYFPCERLTDPEQ